MPLSPIDRIRLDKAAVDEGFGLSRPDDGGWLAYDSLGTPASIRLMYAEPNYLVAVNHPGAAAELSARWQKLPPTSDYSAPAGFTAFMVSGTEALHHLVRDIWRLAHALPSKPLQVFETKIRDLPRTTEAERLVVQRVGQDVFRDALMTYWGGRCPLTGVGNPRLLRASHIKAWAECDTDAERLDVYNGLLLAVHLDAAFDAGLISFADDGKVLFSAAFVEEDRSALGISENLVLSGLTEKHHAYMRWHRENPHAKCPPYGAA